MAVGRLALSSFSLLGVLLDSTQPAEQDRFAAIVLGIYVLYAAIAWGFASRALAPRGRAWLIHSCDVAVLSLLLFAIERPQYLLLPLLVFAFLSGSVRWQWRGALWTGTAILAVFAATSLYRLVMQPVFFEPKAIVVQCAVLVVIAILTGRLGALEARTRRQMRQLATPPDLHSTHAGDDLVGPVLEWAARLTGAPRVLLAWDEPEEPWRELAFWDGRECSRTRERPGVSTSLVADEIGDADFLHRPPAPCLVVSFGGCRRWVGQPLSDSLRTRFSIGPLFSVALTGEAVRARLFFLDKPGMTLDDLNLAGITAHQIAGRLRAQYLARRVEEVAALKERLRLARDLHDGAFHTLTGMALEVERLLRMPRMGLDDAREPLRQIQLSLEDEQRTLRMLIEGLRTSETQSSGATASLETRLKDQVSRIERQWGLMVDFSATNLPGIPVSRWADVCFIVQEALVNAGRHSGASTCRLTVGIDQDCVSIVTADNGRGFPFKGRYDHDQLVRLRIGPSTLRERAAFLGGHLTVESTDAGACVQICVPLHHREPVDSGARDRADRQTDAGACV